MWNVGLLLVNKHTARSSVVTVLKHSQSDSLDDEVGGVVAHRHVVAHGGQEGRHLLDRPMEGRLPLVQHQEAVEGVEDAGAGL